MTHEALSTFQSMVDVGCWGMSPLRMSCRRSCRPSQLYQHVQIPTFNDSTEWTMGQKRTERQNTTIVGVSSLAAVFSTYSICDTAEQFSDIATYYFTVRIFLTFLHSYLSVRILLTFLFVRKNYSYIHIFHRKNFADTGRRSRMSMDKPIVKFVNTKNLITPADTSFFKDKMKIKRSHKGVQCPRAPTVSALQRDQI